MAETDKSRWDKWYGSNKSEHNARRRVRYHSDPEYRERVLQSARDRRRVKAGERGPVKRGPRTFVPLVIDGKTFYKIGAVAKAVGRSTTTLKEWERRGVLPETPYRKSSHRLFTREMVSLVQDGIDKMESTFRFGLDDLKKFFDENWEKCL